MLTGYDENLKMAFDYYGKEAGYGAVLGQTSPDDEVNSKNIEGSGRKQSRACRITEDLWQATRKRHVESRQHWRHLLDKHIRPH